LNKPELFDDWPERYEHWFSTPVGKLVRKTETELVMRLLTPLRNELILDAGCGTGVFTTDFLDTGARVVGLDISAPMLAVAKIKSPGQPFHPVRADILHLPFPDAFFDKTVSVTALEFIVDANRAINELFRVTRPGGLVVVATLNSLSPWAERRRAKTRRGQHHVLENAVYRSPNDLLSLSPLKGETATCIHFKKDDDIETAKAVEHRDAAMGLNTGAFVAVRWRKPA